jgi:ABC-2 type transport system permease protein
MLWGIISCAATFAVSIVKERSAGTFQRLRVAPIGRSHILAGKGLACFLSCICVLIIQCLAAKIIFKMPVGSPSLFVVASLCTILCFVGLMMLACTLGRTEQSAGAIGWAAFIVLAMLGGGMMPLFFMPGWLQKISSVSPVKWGILAIEGAVWRDFSAMEMLTPCAILIAIGLLAFTSGVLMLRRTDA